jgi:acyl carrier protein
VTHCRLFSCASDDEDWILHVQARGAPRRETAAALETSLAELAPAEQFYDECAAVGLTLTPDVRALRALRRADRESFGELVGTTCADMELSSMPATCLQAAVELIAACKAIPQTAWVPVVVRRLQVLQTPDIRWGRGSLEFASDRELVGRAVFWTKDGNVAAEIEGLRLRAAPRDIIEKASTARISVSARAREIRPEWTAAFYDAGPEQRREMLTALLREMVASHLGLESVDALPENTGLFEAGLDSLAIVDIRNRLQRALGQDREVPIAILFNCPTPELLAEFVVREYFGDTSDARVDPVVTEVQNLSEEHLDQSLREFLR